MGKQQPAHPCFLVSSENRLESLAPACVERLPPPGPATCYPRRVTEAASHSARRSHAHLFSTEKRKGCPRASVSSDRVGREKQECGGPGMTRAHGADSQHSKLLPQSTLHFTTSSLLLCV